MKALDKEHLREEFSKDYRTYYSTELFEREGFGRNKCKVCGKHFWSISERDACDDPDHTPYSFFKERPSQIGYRQMWEKFADFFKKNGHAQIDRYPVVSRWRNDLYFTIASIQDFQRIENGAMSFEYSANPLIVPQVCLRFSDIENAGVTGRHFTSFMMAGQHAFNYPKEGYWRDVTMDLNFKFLTQVLGVDKRKLLYNEDVWAMGDFSEFGPSLEFFSGGLELGNSVFTQFESINGKISELKGKVVDVGWGFERLMWFYSGYDNAYEAVFGDVLKKVEGRIGADIDKAAYKRFASLASELDVTEKGGHAKEMEIVKKAGLTVDMYNKKVKPLQGLYAVLDHTRTLLFAISDGALPSNIGGGYNLRVILRRSLGFINEYNLGVDLFEIAQMQAEELRTMYPELYENTDIFNKVIEVEKSRYEKSKANAGRVIEAILSKKKSIDARELRTLYESNGITPELISATAQQQGISIELPQSNYKDIIKGDFNEKEKARKIDIDVSGIEKTKQLYYDFVSQSSAKVLKVEKNLVVLDQSVFYPDGGGQAAERGVINGLEVADVQKVADVIVHIMRGDPLKDGKISVGAIVQCTVDMERRRRLMVHHSATHLMSAAARAVLGKHAWQEGTRKEEDKAHIDVTHYDKLGEEDVANIEAFANNAIFNGIVVNAQIMDRGEAERRFGFSIYQGHGVPSKKMRIVTISDRLGNIIDAEACGGMHVIGQESLMGMIKVIGSSRIHDGVDRLEYVAGPAGMDYFVRTERELSCIAQLFNTEKFATSGKVGNLRESYANMMKELDTLADVASDEIARSYEKSGEREIIIEIGAANRALMRKSAEKIASKDERRVVLISNKNKEIVCICGKKFGDSAIDFVKKKFKESFVGGGSKRIAEGRLVGVA